MHSDTLSGTTRPTSYDDLPDYQRAGHVIATMTAPEQFLTYPELGTTLLAAVAQAKDLGLWDDAAGAITVPLTETELDSKLEAAQRQWDTTRERYYEAVADPGSVNAAVWRNTLNRWAAAEGLAPVAWPED